MLKSCALKAAAAVKNGVGEVRGYADLSCNFDIEKMIAVPSACVQKEKSFRAPQRTQSMSHGAAEGQGDITNIYDI